jgi:hypothetical protein
MSVTICQLTWTNIPEDLGLQIVVNSNLNIVYLLPVGALKMGMYTACKCSELISGKWFVKYSALDWTG